MNILFQSVLKILIIVFAFTLFSGNFLYNATVSHKSSEKSREIEDENDEIMLQIIHPKRKTKKTIQASYGPDVLDNNKPVPLQRATDSVGREIIESLEPWNGEKTHSRSGIYYKARPLVAFPNAVDFMRQLSVISEHKETNVHPFINFLSSLEKPIFKLKGKVQNDEFASQHPSSIFRPTNGRKIHFYKIENLETRSILYLLGSMHIVNLSSLPVEIQEILSSANCLFTEIFSDMDPAEAERIEDEQSELMSQMIRKKLIDKGLFRESNDIGFLDKYKDDKDPDTLGWFDIVKPSLKPELVENFDTWALEENFADSSSFCNRFHPLAFSLMFDLFKGGEYFSEHEQGMDNQLVNLFRSIKKPIYALETEVDRDMVTQELSLDSHLETLGYCPDYSREDLDDLCHLLNDMAQEDKQPSSIYDYDKQREEYFNTTIASYENNINDATIKLKKYRNTLEETEEGSELYLLWLDICNLCESTLKANQAFLEYLKEEKANYKPAMLSAVDYYLNGEVSNYLAEDEKSDIVLRNKNWEPTLRSLLDQYGQTFSVVVGVGHLYGTYGTLNFLSDIPSTKISRWNLEAHGFERLKGEEELEIMKHKRGVRSRNELETSR